MMKKVNVALLITLSLALVLMAIRLHYTEDALNHVIDREDTLRCVVNRMLLKENLAETQSNQPISISKK